MEPMTAESDMVTAASTKTFTIVAKQWSFTITPSPFVVNQGDSVTLDITSSDVGHGFFLEQYSTGMGVTYGKGQHRMVSFVANTPGTFTYVCTDATCGSGHTTMTGEMTVTAAGNPPSISSFTPRLGPAGGGTVVAISGSDFQNNAAVKFGDASAVSVSVSSANSINAISPVHAAGDVTLTVANPDGQSASLGSFTYLAPGPTITLIAPSSGLPSGGTPVSISGTGFTGATPVSVTFDGIAGTDVHAISATSLTVVAPAHAAGTVDLAVTVGANHATARSGFSYLTPTTKRRAVKPQ